MKEFEIHVFRTKADFKGMMTIERARKAGIFNCDWILAEFSKNGKKAEDIIKINRRKRKDCDSYSVMFTLRNHVIEKLHINKNSLVKMKILSKYEHISAEEMYAKKYLNSANLIPKTVEMSRNRSSPLVFYHENKLFSRIRGSNLLSINKKISTDDLSAVAIGGIFGESNQNLATYFAFVNSSPFFHRIVLDFLTENIGIRMKDIYGKLTYHGPTFDDDIKKRLFDFYTHTTGIERIVMDTYKVAENVNKIKWPNGCLSICINGFLANQFMINLIKKAPLHDNEFLKGFMIGFSNAECSVNTFKGNIACYKLNFKEGHERKAGKVYQRYFNRLGIRSSIVYGCNQIFGPLELSKLSTMTVSCGKEEIGPLYLTPHKEVIMMRGLRNHCQIRILELLEEFSDGFYEAIDISRVINQKFGLNFSKHDVSNNLRVIDPEYAKVEIKNGNRKLPNKYRIFPASKYHEIHDIIRKLDKRLQLAEKNLAYFNRTLKKFRLGSIIIDKNLKKIVTHPSQ